MVRGTGDGIFEIIGRVTDILIHQAATAKGSHPNRWTLGYCHSFSFCPCLSGVGLSRSLCTCSRYFDLASIVAIHVVVVRRYLLSLVLRSAYGATAR